MKSDTKIENSKIANIYSSDFFFKIFLAEDAFIENINSETCTINYLHLQ